MQQQTFNTFDYDDSPQAPVKLTVPDDYKAVRERILEAIRDGFCTARGIKIHLCLSNAFNLFPYLEQMILDRDIYEVECGANTAYFGRARIPAKFYLGGAGGRVICVWEGKALLEPPPEISKVESRHWRAHSNAAIFNRPVLEKPEGDTVLRGVRKTVDYNLLERLVAEGKTNPEVCAALGINRMTFYNRMRSDAEFKAAVLRGRQAQAGK